MGKASTKRKLIDEPLSSLVDSETKFRVLVENLSEGVNFCDTQEIFLYANSRLSEMTGYTLEEMVGRSTYDLIIPEDQIPYVRERIQQRKRGRAEHYELLMKRKDGSRFWALVSASPIKNSAGKVVASVAVIADITEQKRTHEAVKESERKYRNLVETSSDLIWSIDLDGRWTFVNEAARQIYGYAPEEMLGKFFTDFQSPLFAERDKKVFAKILDGKPVFNYETEHLRRDSSKLRLSFNAIPLKDNSGAVIGTTGTASDVTLQRRAEESLRSIVEATASATAENFFRSLVFHLAEVLGTSYAFVSRVSDQIPDHADMLALWSRDKYLEQISYPISGTPSERVLEGKIQYFPKGVREAFPLDKGLALTGADGYLGAPIFDSAGKAIGVVGVCDEKPVADIEPARAILKIFAARAGAELERLHSEKESIRLQRQFLQSQKMEAIGQLAAGVAHDLNNSLGAVVGHLQLLKLNPELKTDVQRSVDIALSGCERASSLIEQLLGFSRQGTYNLVEVSAARMVNETIRFLGRVVSKEVRIIEEKDDLDLFIHADEAQLQQALVNLIINATQAMPNGGTIRFGFSLKKVSRPDRFNVRAKPGLYVVISVTDSGVGIPAERLDKIFEPFFTTKLESKGTGLGLAMVYGSMQNHGGWVEVESQSDKGSVFSLYFPQAIPKGRTATESSKEMIANGHGQVLVIDDEGDLVELTTIFFKRAGISAKGFTVASEAVEWFRQHHTEVDLVVLDMKMPNMDGSACFEALKRIDPKVRVVILSGYMQDRAVQALLEKGAAKFFQKPLKYPELTAWVADRLKA